MKFQDSGLLNDRLVESAFDYAQAYTQSLAKEVLANYTDLINAINADYRDELDLLGEMLKYGDITQQQFDFKKADLDSLRDADLKDLRPETIPAGLEAMFRDNAVATALEIQRHSDNAAPALIAAAMLSECARSPVDCKKIEKQFGGAIADMIGEILDVDAYPADHDEKTADASSDTRRLLMASLTNSFRKAAAVVDDLAVDERASMPEERAEKAFAEAKTLWGNDKKLDTRLVAVFNHAAEVLSSPYRLEVSGQGVLELVREAAPPKTPAKPPSGKKPGGFGDDGF